jgi:hypothetical protein
MLMAHVMSEGNQTKTYRNQDEMNRANKTALILLLCLSAIAVGDAFTYPALPSSSSALTTARRPTWTQPYRRMSHAPEDGDPSEIVAKRILVKGDVGGYYRQCVVNEVRDGLKLGACARKLCRHLDSRSSTIVLLLN